MPENKGKHIARRMIIALLSIAMIIGFIVLFVAASKDRNKAVCKALVIHVAGDNPVVYVNKSEIASFITKDKKLDPVGRQLSDVDVKLLERSVKTFPWVKDAELYVDNDNILQVNITERTPVARVFTVSGNSFYLDDGGIHLPVNGSFAARIPVFTHAPADAPAGNAKDSLLYTQMVALSRYISEHPFWKAQVDQVNINGRGEFELIPTVGDVLIEFGPGDDIGEKFDKLLTFYQKALNNVGWGYYDTLYLQYKGQVVASRKYRSESPVVDSLLTSDGYRKPDSPLKK